MRYTNYILMQYIKVGYWIPLVHKLATEAYYCVVLIYDKRPARLVTTHTRFGLGGKISQVYVYTTVIYPTKTNLFTLFDHRHIHGDTQTPFTTSLSTGNSFMNRLFSFDMLFLR